MSCTRCFGPYVDIEQDKVKKSPKSDFAALSFLKDARNRLHVSSSREVVDARNDVPIVMMEQDIMEAINENPTVIIRGKAGYGKTTQVPQLALVQRNVLLEVVLSVLLNPTALQSLRPLSMWRMSLVYNWVRRLDFNLDMTKRLVKVAPSNS